MCVGSVCTQPPYNDKNPPAPFFNPHKYFELKLHRHILGTLETYIISCKKVHNGCLLRPGSTKEKLINLDIIFNYFANAYLEM